VTTSEVKCCFPATGNEKTCDDSNPCTDDSCDEATGVCSNIDVLDPGQRCSDDLYCTINGCNAQGQCTTEPRDCQGNDGCRDYSCDEANDQCVSEAHGKCNDNLYCSQDTCTSTGSTTYECSYTASCTNLDDGNPCTKDECVEKATTFECAHTEWETIDPDFCTDGNPCTINRCDPDNYQAPPNGPCVAEFNEDRCDDSNPCTVDVCAPNSGGGNNPCTYTLTQCTSQDSCSLPACAANVTILNFNGTEVEVGPGCYDILIDELLDACGICDGDGISCFLNNLQGASSTTIIGAGAGAGIGVAVLAGVGLAAWGSYEGYQHFAAAGNDGLGTAQSNPAYTEDEMGGEMPDGVEMS